MLILWIFAWSLLAKDNLKDLEACKAENMKPLVCKKFEEKHKFERW